MTFAPPPAESSTSGSAPVRHGVGRSLGESSVYARSLGIEGRFAKRKINRAGGVEKLQGVEECARNVLLKSTGPRPASWGLRARGLRTYTSFAQAQEIEARIQAILRERGLL